MRLKYDFFWIVQEGLVGRFRTLWRKREKKNLGHDILYFFRTIFNTLNCILCHLNNMQFIIVLNTLLLNVSVFKGSFCVCRNGKKFLRMPQQGSSYASVSVHKCVGLYVYMHAYLHTEFH